MYQAQKCTRHRNGPSDDTLRERSQAHLMGDGENGKCDVSSLILSKYVSATHICAGAGRKESSRRGFHSDFRPPIQTPQTNIGDH